MRFFDVMHTSIRRFLESSGVKLFYFACKRFSGRFIYPRLPRFHEFVFILLKAKIRRLYFKSLANIPNAPVTISNYTGIIEEERCYYPKISVIVPNFQHAKYLEQRLRSIYEQTYKNIEVILLDDASGDASVAILDKYYGEYPEITIRCYNSENSGSVFRQWRRGFDLASGDLVWIAESDDYCSENFLDELVKLFKNNAVMLAYTATVFVGGHTAENIWTIEEYLEEIDPLLWKQPFVASAHQLVNKAWGIKNIVPNVSSAVFRHPGRMELMDDSCWQEMRICGDWVFYLHIVRGGLVAYTNAATNYYRIHSNNTSTATYAQDSYYKEHMRVAEELVLLYFLAEGVLDRQKTVLESHWNTYRSRSSESELKQHYDISRLKQHSCLRKQNVMMVTSAFVAGGGEILAIKLANALKIAGYSVSLLNCRFNETEPGIRGLVQGNIPVFELNQLDVLPDIVKDMKVEIIHSHHAWADYTICSLLEKNEDVKIVVTMHGMYEFIDTAEFKEMLPLFARRVNRFVYLADKNLVPFEKSALEASRFVNIGNALDVFAIKTITKTELGIAETAFVVCLVSRAIPEKGWQEAIDAVVLARKLSGCDIHLVLIGEGPECSRLQALTHADYIHLLGFKVNVREYFAMADLGLLPTYYPGESYPLVLIDCLQAGRPFVASNVGEIAAMLAAEDGYAGTVFDLVNGSVPIATVAEIISNYAVNREVYQKHRESVSPAVKKFDMRIMLEKYCDVYQSVCGREGAVAQS